MKSIIIERDTRTQQALYSAAVDHVQAVYRHCFGATVRQAPPRFAVTLAPNGQIACAASIRIAADGFFSQCYLDRPVADILGDRFGPPVAAGDLLEVGALATFSPFPVHATLCAILDWGRERDIEWGLFTATAQVRRLIRRTGIEAQLIEPARSARVDRPQDWGSYYDKDPWVCAFHDGANRSHQAAPAESA